MKRLASLVLIAILLCIVSTAFGHRNAAAAPVATLCRDARGRGQPGLLERAVAKDSTSSTTCTGSASCTSKARAHAGRAQGAGQGETC